MLIDLPVMPDIKENNTLLTGAFSFSIFLVCVVVALFAIFYTYKNRNKLSVIAEVVTYILSAILMVMGFSVHSTITDYNPQDQFSAEQMAHALRDVGYNATHDTIRDSLGIEDHHTVDVDKAIGKQVPLTRISDNTNCVGTIMDDSPHMSIVCDN